LKRIFEASGETGALDRERKLPPFCGAFAGFNPVVIGGADEELTVVVAVTALLICIWITGRAGNRSSCC